MKAKVVFQAIIFNTYPKDYHNSIVEMEFGHFRQVRVALRMVLRIAFRLLISKILRLIENLELLVTNSGHFMQV